MSIDASWGIQAERALDDMLMNSRNVVHNTIGTLTTEILGLIVVSPFIR
jgi:hypothetical protein